MRQEYKDLARRSLEIEGVDRMLGHMSEECAELIVSMQHKIRERVKWDAVAEECADVALQLETMRHILADNGHDLDQWIDFKAQKWENRVSRKEREV